MQDNLKNILDELLNQSTYLIDFLKKENNALLNDDTDQILEIAAKKQELYANFDRTEKKFLAIVKEKDENWKKDTKISTLWENLINQISACKRQNLINGLSMNQQISSLKRFISFLSCGYTADKVCYDKKADIQTEKNARDKAVV